jgi:hypothetical protein
VLQLQIPRRDVGHRCHDERELVRNVAAKVADELREGADVPRLGHPQDEGDDPESERKGGADPERQACGVVPAVEVVVGKVALAEEVVLEEEDDGVAEYVVSRRILML